MPIDIKQYDSALAFIDDDKKMSRVVGNVQNDDDKKRIKAYELYEDFYSNRPEHIRVTLRGEDDDSVEIYLPSAKKCIEAVNRFFAIDFDYQIDPETGGEVDHQAVDQQLSTIFDTQQVKTKINNFKRYGLVKGDALLHLKGVPWERSGNRICVHELKPEHYFPIEDPVTGYVNGCHIVDIIRNPKNSDGTRRVSDKDVARRQTYRRVMQEDSNGNKWPTGRITSELVLCKIGRWDDRTDETKSEMVIIDTVQKEFELPDKITNIPVYHWANRPPPGSTFGISELAGVESLINAMNQSMTDEDLTLVTHGLGVYWSDASPPVDENGDEVEWQIGPGSVVQVATGANFGSVQGVSSLEPFHEHIKLLDENMQQAMSVPDVAIGMVDVQAVESGIALQLKFGPLLAHNKEKEPTIEKVINEFLEDLLIWLEVYEGLEANGAVVTAIFGDPMPVNKSQMLEDYLSIWQQAAGTLPVVDWLYERLNELYGWDLSDADFQQALEDAKAIAESSAPPDPFGGQMLDQQGNPIDAGNNTMPQNNGVPLPFATTGG